MTFFATEFPVRPVTTSATFVAEVVTWLRGSEYSTVLDDAQERDLEGDAPVIRAQSGEELRLRVLSRDGRPEAFGFRHDLPDQEGRLWRTEAVLRKAAATVGQDIIRLRTQCIAQRPNARLETPRKPFLLKSVLRNGLGGIDGVLDVSDRAIWLGEDDVSLELAREATLGVAARYLPVIFVSAVGRGRWELSREDIDRLAYRLGGVAHVVVEPDRAFSFRLRDRCDGRNVYGGTIGVVVPGQGVRRKIYTGDRVADRQELQAALADVAGAVRSQMPSDGWDWTDLQEQALRQQRERERARLSPSQAEELYEAEIATLNDRIGQLKDELVQATSARVEAPEKDLLSMLPGKLGPEIYPGEMVDRLRMAARMTIGRADQDGLDARSREMLQRFAALPASAGLSEFLEDLKRATKDAGRLADQVTTLMSRHGYREKSRNRHVRLEPQEGFVGLEAITVPTTPSDARGLINMRKQIERALGVSQHRS